MGYAGLSGWILRDYNQGVGVLDTELFIYSKLIDIAAGVRVSGTP